MTKAGITAGQDTVPRKKQKFPKTNTVQHHLHAESEKMIRMILFTKQKQTHRLKRWNLGLLEGKGGGGRDRLGFGD